jgi:HlyD family secretion protein
MKIRTLIIAGAVVVAGAAAAWLFWPRGESFQYVTRPVGYSDIAATVQETGTVNPVNQVAVGTEVSGTVRTISVDFNSVVRKGQELLTIDPTSYQAAVSSAEASLQLALANQHSAEVAVGKTKALLDMANLTLDRDKPLLDQNLINQNQVDLDKTSAIGAQQDYLGSLASVESAKAQVAVVQAQLAQARYNMTKTVITSPIDGLVLARNVSVGQTVAASLSTPTLFTLASNQADMQVDTSVDEADAGGVKRGAKARITVPAFPNVVFPGTVSQVRLNPTVVQNVVTYDAVVHIDDTSGRLFPGMTAQVTIETGLRGHVLSVPLPALLYNPAARQSGGAGQGGFPGGAGGGAGGGGNRQGGGGGSFSAGVVQTQGGAGALAGAPGSRVTVWVLRETPVPVTVVIGVSDGRNVEIVSGDIGEGDQVIVAQRRERTNRQPRDGQGAPTSPAPAPGQAKP